MTIFVPGKLRNPLNGSWGGWRKHARLAKDWRERTSQYVLLYGLMRPSEPHSIPEVPKVVTFTAHTRNKWDSDEGINSACKPLRDGLVDGRIIHSDDKDSGHVFRYQQKIDRKKRGVEITVEPLSSTEAP